MTALPITQLTPPHDRIELSIGQPDPALLPASLFESNPVDPKNLAYGHEAGDGRFRDSLAAWLGRHYSVPVAPESLMITNGSSNALDMICTRLGQTNKTVLVEDPTYFIARRQLADHGFTVTAVPMDESGVDLAALERLIHTHRPAFFYTIPTFHNPTGITQSAERRAALVRLGRETGCPIVADEVYPLLHYNDRTPPPLASYDDDATVLSVGSFSKILAPGLRLGWIQGTPATLKHLLDGALLASGGGLAPVTSSLVRPLIDDGRLDIYLESLRETYRKRRNVLVDSLTQHLNDRLTFTVPEGGYFLWGRLKEPVESASCLPHALEHGVGFLPGDRFSDSPVQARCLRLCFAFYDESELFEAGRRLGQAIS